MAGLTVGVANPGTLSMGSAPAGSRAGQVYWTGTDGNVYLKTSTGVTNLGTPQQAQVWNLGLNGAQEIADPNPGGGGAGGGGGGSAPASTGASFPALNRGAVNNTQLAIDQIPGLLAAALANEDTSYGNTIAGYDAQEGQQRGTYDKSTTTNQQNYDSNFMDSIRAGIKGFGNMLAILRGTGAAGGTAQDMVQDTVGGVTANDIRTGADTRDQNQGALDASLSQFLTDLKGKRQLADDTHINNRSAISRDSNTQLQDLYSKMAGFYGDAGMTGQRDDFMGRAGALTPTIAGNSKAVTSRYDTTPVAVAAPQLTAFAAPSAPDVASVPQDGQVGSGIFTMSRKRPEQVAVPTAAPVGA